MQSSSTKPSDGLVLLVEDEESLGDLLVHLLGRAKIRALRAGDGNQALQIFSDHQREIVMAFVDCRLPDIDGGDLCRELRRLSPGLPLLLTSGRDQRALVTSLAGGGRTGFLQKPYMPADVVRHVNALLSQPA
ncbi:response regulator transcription factor [Opitutus terrae]|uniref:response regulator transcription factor n=1 Tax=Opitutus terrae TaxID=107709 RepID=UPI0002DBFCF5|nr:response regulator [Opitutus terrae]